MNKFLQLSLILTCLSGSIVNAAQPNTTKASVAASVDVKAEAEKGIKSLISTAAFQTTLKLNDEDLYTRREACRESLKAQLIAAGIKPTIEQSKTYNGREINRGSLAQLAPAPVQVDHAVSKWLTENPDFAKTALGYELMIAKVRPFHEKTWQLLQKKGLKNLSQCNYAFQIPGTDLVLHAAGHVNRKENLKRLASVLAGTKYEWGKPLTEDDWITFKKHLPASETDKVKGKKGSIVTDKAVVEFARVPKTYQTVSRVATYLLFKEAEKRHQFKHVVTPDTYMVHITGRPNDLSDRNFVAVQKMEAGLEDVVSLSKEEEHEIIIILREIGLFCCNKGSLKRRKSDGKIVILDFEQPNNSNPLQFFHKNFDLFIGNGEAGMWDYIENFVIKK